MKIRTLTEMVRNNQKVKFLFYRAGKLFYQTECGFIFEVPTSDCGDACFVAEDKALLFMRWLRPALEAVNAEVK